VRRLRWWTWLPSRRLVRAFACPRDRQDLVVKLVVEALVALEEGGPSACLPSRRDCLLALEKAGPCAACPGREALVAFWFALEAGLYVASWWVDVAR
jgi:hypothetical protein